MRPRTGCWALVRRDGKVFLTREVYDALMESADSRGILRLRWIGWDVEEREGRKVLVLWPTTLNPYSVSLNVSGPRKTIQFRSRTLAKIVGEGKKQVEVI